MRVQPLAVAGHLLGQAEVGDVRLVVGVEQDVGRLEVAVQHAVLWAWSMPRATPTM